MQIDAVKPGPVSQPPVGPQGPVGPQSPDKKDPAAKQPPADAPIMNPGQPPADEFKSSSKK